MADTPPRDPSLRPDSLRPDLGAGSTTDEVVEGVDLTGSVAVVTGASGGLGLETARALASVGADVVLVGRDAQKLEAARARLAEAGLPGVASTQLMDLASLRSVRGAAAALAAAQPRIDVLVANAGVMACPLQRTADGFEMQLGTNHIGHAAFVTALLDNLRAAAPSRVVVLSSAGHRTSGIRWDDPNFEHSKYHNFTAYGQSKTANALFALELDRRCSADGISAFSVHPGVVATDLARHMTAEDFEWMRARLPKRGADDTSGPGGFRIRDVAEGAATSVWAATDPGLAAHGGAYLEDCSVAEHTDDPASPHGVQPWARDPEQAARLWELTEEWISTR